MNVNYYFNDFEKEYINRLCKGKKITEYTRENVLSDLESVLFYVSGGDEDLVKFIKNIIDTVQKMSDEEWDALKLLTPFPITDFDEDDEEDI